MKYVFVPVKSYVIYLSDLIILYLAGLNLFSMSQTLTLVGS